MRCIKFVFSILSSASSKWYKSLMEFWRSCYQNDLTFLTWPKNTFSSKYRLVKSKKTNLRFRKLQDIWHVSGGKRLMLRLMFEYDEYSNISLRMQSRKTPNRFKPQLNYQINMGQVRKVFNDRKKVSCFNLT